VTPSRLLRWPPDWYREIVERLKGKLGVSTDADVAIALLMLPEELDERLASGSLPFDRIVYRAMVSGDLSLDALFAPMQLLSSPELDAAIERQTAAVIAAIKAATPRGGARGA
jgi:hypothetical protein